MKEMRRYRRILAAMLAVLLLLSGCGHRRVTQETEEVTYGIDVARYQGTIDWQQVAQSGVDFAMIRVGYRAMGDGEIKADVNARYNMQECSKYGIPMGVYFFSTAISEEEAVEEAQWVAQIISQYPITYPVAYDCEGFMEPESRQYTMTKEERTDVAMAFLAEIEKQGYEGMFYASKNDMTMDARWETTRIERKYKIWVAQYPAEAYPATEQSSYEGIHHMWQHSMSGTVPGISQSVDLNVAYFGYDGIEPARSKIPPEEAQPDVEAMMDFREVDEQVTAKVETNLRDIPSQDTDSTVLMTLQNGQVAHRIAVSSSGWSKIVYEGVTYYAVSSYLTTDLDYDPNAVPAQTEDDGIETEFRPVNESVTAKVAVNLRKLPSVEDEDATVIYKLKNGEIATRVGISDNGWSKLVYNGITCYAVSSYLITVDAPTVTTPPQQIQTQFEPVDDLVTAKVEVNLRTLPSVEDPDCVVVATLKNGQVVRRTGINRDVGWSRVIYNGQTLYCITSYLTGA